jgi:5-hydroxyisourate hydrolase
MTLSTHILDTGTGLPATGVEVLVHRYDDEAWRLVATARTDDDGRVAGLVEAASWRAGQWRLTFDTGAYLGPDAFWPEVTVTFAVADAARHHHVPLLLSRYGYSTYRGS